MTCSLGARLYRVCRQVSRILRLITVHSVQQAADTGHKRLANLLCGPGRARRSRCRFTSTSARSSRTALAYSGSFTVTLRSTRPSSAPKRIYRTTPAAPAAERQTALANINSMYFCFPWKVLQPGRSASSHHVGLLSGLMNSCEYRAEEKGPFTKRRKDPKRGSTHWDTLTGPPQHSVGQQQGSNA